MTNEEKSNEEKTEQEMKGISAKELYTLTCGELPEPRLVARSPEVHIAGLV